MRALLFLLLASPALAAAPATCPIEKSVYQLKEAPAGTTLRFQKAAKPNAWSRLEAVIHSPATGRTWRFSYTASNGYSTQYLVQEAPKPTSEDNSGSPLYLFTAALTSINLPQPGEPAPRYAFLPDIGKSFWYGTVSPAPKVKREFLPTELWELSACR